MEVPVEPWSGDVFGRRGEGEYITSFILGRIKERGEAGGLRNYVLTIDAGWGRGKTFFLNGLAAYLRELGHPVAHINAWRDDFANDPMLPVMSSIEDVLTPFLDRNPTARPLMHKLKKNGMQVVAAMGRSALGVGLQKITGMTIEGIVDELNADTPVAGNERSEDEIAKASGDIVAAGVKAGQETIERIIDELAIAEVDGFRKSRKAIEDFSTNLSELLERATKENVPMPLLVLVDELDRCRPDYAVALLERTKHLFEVENVVFVFATNTEQLGHAVRAVYGSGFDGERYLHRFFDRTYHLATPSVLKFVEDQLSLMPKEAVDKLAIPPNSTLPAVIAFEVESYGLDLRGIEQCMDLMRTIVTTWSQKVLIELVVLLPMIIGRQRGITPSFTRSFIQSLETLAVPAGSTIEGPKFRVRAPQAPSQMQVADAAQMFEMFVRAVADVRTHWNQDDTGSQLHAWVGDQLDREASARGLSTQNFAQQTLLRKYPAMIDMAGRLSPD